jgi:hypothetical protein
MLGFRTFAPHGSIAAIDINSLVDPDVTRITQSTSSGEAVAVSFWSLSQRANSLEKAPAELASQLDY